MIAAAKQFEGQPEERLQILKRELDRIKAEAEAQAGADDVAYIAKLKRIADASEVVGRALLHLAFEPVGFGLGVLALSNYYSLTTFIGHSVAHRCYHGLPGGEPFHLDQISSRSSPITAEVWAKGHNLHHAHTDVVFQDPDLAQLPQLFRLSNEIEWNWRHLFQPPLMAIAVLNAMWFQAIYYNGLIDGFKEREQRWFLKEVTAKSYLESLLRFLKGASNHVLVDYLLFPALAGPFFWKVLAGNLLAEGIANVWVALVTLGTHYGAGDDVEFSAESPRGKAEWYLSQIEGTTDVSVPRLFDHQTVALSHHIAHHLFPHLPPNRLIEITPRIREVCRRLDIPFREQSAWRTSLNVVKRVLKFALPSS